MRTICLLVAMASLVAAQDHWPHWRGPVANGTAPTADPPTKWSATEGVRWKTAIPGKGSATPIIWGDRVFVVSAEATDRRATAAELPKVDAKFDRKTEPPSLYYRFLVYCLDRQSGKVLWKTVATEKIPHEGHHETHSYSAGSPTTDGERLYVSFGSFGYFCYSLDGKLLWSRDLGRLTTRLGWGEAVTPVVHGESLLLNLDQEEGSRLVCLDPKSGATKWETPRQEKTSWNTPLVVEHAGTVQVVMNGTSHVRGYDLATGKQLWEGPGTTVNAIPSPVAADGTVYLMSGYRGSVGMAIPLASRGEAKPTWTIAKGTPYVPSPLLSKGKLYFTQANVNLLTIVDATSGKVVLDQERLSGVRGFYGSPIAAAGRVYLTDRDGTTLVFPEGEKVDVMATNRLNDPIDGSPAAVGKHLFLRSHSAVYCIGEK